MLDELKVRVYESYGLLIERGMVPFTWGNTSGRSDDGSYVAITPSGVPFQSMKPADIVVVDLETSAVVEGDLVPSCDWPTHREIYLANREIAGIVHAHSKTSVAFAQAGMPIASLGTTHADCFLGDIPCTRELHEDEVVQDFEANTGKVITELFRDLGISYLDITGVLVRNHGPFAWGTSVEAAAESLTLMEWIAEANLKTLLLNPSASMPSYILQKHYLRKHGEDAYYGQR